jgi:hypothetical protein
VLVGRVTEISGGRLLDALAELERAEQRVGICKAYAHIARMIDGDRQEELLSLLDCLEEAEERLIEAHDKAGEASEVLMGLIDPRGVLRGQPALGPAAEG